MGLLLLEVRSFTLATFGRKGPFSLQGAPGFPGLVNGCRTSLDFWGFGTFGGTPHLSDACVPGSGAGSFYFFWFLVGASPLGVSRA